MFYLLSTLMTLLNPKFNFLSTTIFGIKLFCLYFIRSISNYETLLNYLINSDLFKLFYLYKAS